jgi:uncharacterized membrane protein YhaH (DUF805 family)
MFKYQRTNRASYWVSIAIVVVLYGAISLVAPKPPPIAETVIAVIAIPRLHDIGKSAWYAGAVFLAEIVVVTVSFATLPPKHAFGARRTFVIIVVGLLIWLGCIPSDRNTNKYGEPPRSGISVYPWTKRS